jgi:hypothetical protein
MSLFTLLEIVDGHQVEAMQAPCGVIIRDTIIAPGGQASVAMVFMPEVELDLTGDPEIKPTRPGRQPHGT